MSLRNAILGLLHFSDMSGYDLSQIFDHSIRNYWSTEHTQIYRALLALSDDGSLTSDVIVQQGKPDKKIYHLTEKGKTDFRSWLVSELPLPEIRHSHLLQFSFMESLPLEDIIRFLEKYAEQINEKLNLYHNPQHLEFSLKFAHTEKEQAIWSLVLENGIRYYEAELGWCRHAIEILGGMQDENN